MLTYVEMVDSGYVTVMLISPISFKNVATREVKITYWLPYASVRSPGLSALIEHKAALQRELSRTQVLCRSLQNAVCASLCTFLGRRFLFPLGSQAGVRVHTGGGLQCKFTSRKSWGETLPTRLRATQG